MISLSRSIIALSGLAAVFAAISTAYADDLTSITIGWQPTTTVEAQVAHTLESTDILERNGLKGKFIMFSYGPNVNEALASGSIDVGFIGDLPSIALVNSGAPVRIVAQQSTFRGSIIASSGSGIQTMEDLEGHRIYGSVGSSIYLAALGMLKEADVRSEVDIINMGFTNLADVIKAKKIDAAFLWDPWIENFNEQGLAHVVASDSKLTMMIAMRDAYLDEHPSVLKKFLKAEKEALLFAANNHSRTNAWFKRPAAARALETSVIEKATAYDSRWQAKDLEDIRLAFNKAERKRYLALAAESVELELFPRLSVSELTKKLDMGVANDLDANPWPYDVSSVRVK